jgi:hypothetical protein
MAQSATINILNISPILFLRVLDPDQKGETQKIFSRYKREEVTLTAPSTVCRHVPANKQIKGAID